MKIREIQTDPMFQTKENIKRKKKIKKRLFWIKFVLFFILITTSIILLAISPLFTIKSIEVTGSLRYQQNEIIDATGLLKGENGFKSIGSSVSDILTLRAGTPEKIIIKKFPYVKSVMVRFVLPSKIKISIVERTPITFFRFNGTNLLLDDEGYVVDADTGLKTKGLVEIKGIEFQHFELGQQLKMNNPDYFKCFFDTQNAIKSSDESDNYKIGKLLNYIDVTDTRGIIISVDARIRVNLGGVDEMNYRINFLKRILESKISKSEKGFLDLTLDNPVLKPE